LSHYFRHAETIHIDPPFLFVFGSHCRKVTFHAGHSAEFLPPALLSGIDASEPAIFLLIDGDHKRKGVRRRIHAHLSVTPSYELAVLMHYASNPDCRAGILYANWQPCSCLHELEIVFISGVYHQQAFDTATANSMWSDFSFALLKPEPREGDLVISQRQQGLFEAVLLQSSHASQQHSLFQMANARVRKLVIGLT
jgi:hypothetical protein